MNALNNIRENYPAYPDTINASLAKLTCSRSAAAAVQSYVGVDQNWRRLTALSPGPPHPRGRTSCVTQIPHQSRLPSLQTSIHQSINNRFTFPMLHFSHPVGNIICTVRNIYNKYCVSFKCFIIFVHG